MIRLWQASLHEFDDEVNELVLGSRGQASAHKLSAVYMHTIRKVS